MEYAVLIVGVLGALGGIAGLVTAVVAWRGQGATADDLRFQQLRALVDEYRIESERDGKRIAVLEERDAQCQKDLHEAQTKIGELYAMVAELEQSTA